MYQISPVEVASASFICTVKRLYETVYNNNNNNNEQQKMNELIKLKWSSFKKHPTHVITQLRA